MEFHARLQPSIAAGGTAAAGLEAKHTLEWLSCLRDLAKRYGLKLTVKLIDNVLLLVPDGVRDMFERLRRMENLYGV